jgi:hypothetical protein
MHIHHRDVVLAVIPLVNVSQAMALSFICPVHANYTLHRIRRQHFRMISGIRRERNYLNINLGAETQDTGGLFHSPEEHLMRSQLASLLINMRRVKLNIPLLSIMRLQEHSSLRPRADYVSHHIPRHANG